MLRELGPVSAPGAVARVPARRAARAGGALPAAARPRHADNDAVKWAVMTYGGVDAAIDFDTNETDRVLERRHELLLRRCATSSTTTSSAWAGTTRTPPPTSPPAAGRRRLPHQEQLGDGLRRAGLLLALLLRPELRQGTRRVRRRRSPRTTTTPSTSTTRSGAAAGSAPVRRRRERVVREPVHLRRLRRRRRGLVLHARAGDEYEVRVAGSCRASRRRRSPPPARSRSAGYHTVDLEQPGRGDRRTGLRRRRARHHARVDPARARGAALGLHRPARSAPDSPT